VRLRFITPSDTAFHVYNHVVRLGSQSLAKAEGLPLKTIEDMMDGAFDGHQIWVDDKGWESIQGWILELVRAEGIHLVAEHAGVPVEHIEAVLSGCAEASADLASFVALSAQDRAQPKQQQGPAVWLARWGNTGKRKPQIH